MSVDMVLFVIYGADEELIMDDESGPTEAKEVFDQGEEPGNTTDATETGQTANSVSAEKSEDYSLISEDGNPSEDSRVTLEVEVVLRED